MELVLVRLMIMLVSSLTFSVIVVSSKELHTLRFPN